MHTEPVLDTLIMWQCNLEVYFSLLLHAFPFKLELRLFKDTPPPTPHTHKPNSTLLYAATRLARVAMAPIWHTVAVRHTYWLRLYFIF